MQGMTERPRNMDGKKDTLYEVRRKFSSHVCRVRVPLEETHGSRVEVEDNVRNN